MARGLVAIAALTLLGVSFLGATHLLGPGARRDDVAAARPPAPAAIPAPAPARPAPADPAAEADPDGEVRSWAAVAREVEAREEALRDAILSVGEMPADTVDHRLALYRRALRETFEERASVLESRAMLTEVFLRMDSVQQELAAMGPGERSRQLEHIRREMGYTDEEIEHLAELDAHRETRWERGLAYMEERRRLERTFEGEALAEELRHLRERTFAHEADTIAREEADGFFRYERPRVYGRN